MRLRKSIWQSSPIRKVYIGKAQKRFNTSRVSKKFNVDTGQSFPWLTRGTVICNQYYFYVLDEDFGPLFIKFASYFSYTARICIYLGRFETKLRRSRSGIAKGYPYIKKSRSTP
uniref:Uncharacterized protein n=1 Tax=Candidatus Kentrum sp. SD TaxID=2126332 RepID=A0A451BSH2_9GAMM|nr:MAG: hypothetical protein BECKSD772D_GA0070982_12421 [Candidatus Kentron sp. SD]